MNQLGETFFLLRKRASLLLIRWVLELEDAAKITVERK